MAFYNLKDILDKANEDYESCSCHNHNNDLHEYDYNTAIEGDKERFHSIKNIVVISNKCANCDSLFSNTKEVVSFLGIKTKVVYKQYDLEENKDELPILVINDEIVSKGKVLKGQDIEDILNSFDAK